MQPDNDMVSAVLENSGWRRPRYPMVSARSLVLDLSEDNDAWLRSIDQKHRYYVRRTSAARLTWTHGQADPLKAHLGALLEALRADKGVQVEALPGAGLAALEHTSPGTAFILVGYLEGEPVTGCLALVHASKAWYAAASTVGRGRELSAAYAMFAELRRLLRERGVRTLDFGGIDPGSASARGVDHFKSGFGGDPVRYLGEWHWASFPPLRHAMDALIRLRPR